MLLMDLGQDQRILKCSVHSLPEEEQETARLRIVANRRAEAANRKWVEDVRERKLCIANGSGNVHGITYDLEGQFGIGLRRV